MAPRTSFLLTLLLANYACSESSTNETIPFFITASKYTLYTEAVSWLEALLICWKKGASLAVPHSREDATTLSQLLTNATANITGTDMRDAVHVGLTDSKDEGDWWTVDGSSVAATGYNSWFGGQQERNTSAHCAALLNNGHYMQVSCEAVPAFACEPVPTPAERTDGYVDIADIGTYKLHTEPLTWGEAGRRCAEEGATLAVPTSPRAAGLLAGILVTAAADERVRQEGFFVGINDLAAEGAWRTILNERLETTGFATWAPGKPSGGRYNNCGALLADGRYADYPCTKPMPFCCEMGGPGQKDEEPFATLGRYSLFVKGLPWLSAAINCHRRNTTLAAPRNEDEFHTMHSLAERRTNGTKYLHLGALYNKHQHPLKNGNGEKIFYKYVVTNIDSKCITYQPLSDYMSTKNCNEQHPYICESYSKI